MKLLFTNGPQKGKEVELRPPFISIGRETDNDVVLAASEASRYHAKIEIEGNAWLIRDLESRNGVRLNGKRITKAAPLAINDELAIGECVLRLIESAADAPPPDAPADTGSTPAPVSAGEEARQQRLAASAAKAAQQKRIRLLVTGLLTVIVVVGVVLALPTQRGATKPPKPDPLAAVAAEPLRVRYVFEKVGRNQPDQPYNIFTFQVTIDDQTLRVRVRDLRDGLNQDQTITLDAATAAELKHALLTDEFLLAESYRRQQTDRSERLQFLAMAGRRGNYVEYLNEPERVARAVRQGLVAVNKLVDDKTKVNRVPRSQAFAEAERLFLTGVRQLAESSVHPENNYNAVTNLRTAIKYLEGYDNPPEFYAQAQQKLKEAEQKFAETLNSLKEAARFQEKVDLAKAKAIYQEILDRLPDQTHPDYKEAKVKIVTITSKLRKPQ